MTFKKKTSKKTTVVEVLDEVQTLNENVKQVSPVPNTAQKTATGKA